MTPLRTRCEEHREAPVREAFDCVICRWCRINLARNAPGAVDPEDIPDPPATRYERSVEYHTAPYDVLYEGATDDDPFAHAKSWEEWREELRTAEPKPSGRGRLPEEDGRTPSALIRVPYLPYKLDAIGKFRALWESGDAAGALSYLTWLDPNVRVPFFRNLRTGPERVARGWCRGLHGDIPEAGDP